MTVEDWTSEQTRDACTYGTCPYCHTPRRAFVVEHRGTVHVGLHCPLCRPDPIAGEDA